MRYPATSTHARAHNMPPQAPRARLQGPKKSFERAWRLCKGAAHTPQAVLPCAVRCAACALEHRSCAAQSPLTTLCARLLRRAGLPGRVVRTVCLAAALEFAPEHIQQEVLLLAGLAMAPRHVPPRASSLRAEVRQFSIVREGDAKGSVHGIPPAALALLGRTQELLRPESW